MKTVKTLTMTPTFGKLYYDTGELMYEGYFTPHEHDVLHHMPDGRGIKYFRDGRKSKEGTFVTGNLWEGKVYYPSGNLKFEGFYNNKHDDSKRLRYTYYGPSYPVRGKFYLENGTLAYEGEFKVEHQGNVGYPKVVIPEGFGSLD